ncbi:BTAD domain-containing putative transcriptional regulator [Lentzea sp. NPDC006480]|uniref:BTAD domain-containing putative transcriptional regulator n=1 Tax=Lentzea sp. NPDC006480 TaxID=3157176 RepID=UPI0033B36715
MKQQHGSVPAAELGRAPRVQLLGPVRVWLGDLEVTLGSGQARAILGMLAMASGTIVTTRDLVTGLWGENVPQSAKGILHTHISALRRALRPHQELLRSAGTGYLLQVDRDQVDALRLVDAEKIVRTQLAAGAPAAALEAASTALTLWHGEPLSGVPGPRIAGVRSRLTELHHTMVELRAEALLAQGRPDQAVADLTAFLAVDRFRDAARELLMRALHRSGRIAEALDLFRETRTLYVAELGIEPSESLRELRDRILADDHDPVVAQRTSVEPPLGPPLFGRATELEVVRVAMNNLAAGTGSAIWVEGEMGIGKSALLGAALGMAEQLSCQRAYAAAEELGQRFPLRLALECLEIDAHTTDDRKAAIWQALHDDDGSSVSLGGGLPVFGAIDKIVGLVEELCASGPLAVVFDDVQWSDEASLEVIHRLSSLTPSLPLLVIGAARPSPTRAEVTQLRVAVGSVHGDVLDLHPLTDDAVDGMIGALLGARPGDELRRISTRAEGNPLFVREMADILLRDEAVRIDSDTAEVSPGAFDQIPYSLLSAVADRLDLLSAGTHDLLRWAALLGTEFAVSDLATVSEQPIAEVLPAIEEAIAASVLREAGDRLAFRHPFLRQALYGRMPLGLRIALHHQAAEILARSGATPAFVAGQVLAAGEMSPWSLKWLVGVASALTSQAPIACIELLERALEVSGVGERATLMTFLSRALFRVGRDAEAEYHARRALQLLNDPDLAAEMRWIMAYVPYRASRATESIDELEIALADTGLPDLWRARLLSLLSLVLRAGPGDLEAASERAHEGIDLGERARDPFSVGQSLEVLWQVDAVRRDYVRAAGHLDRALAVIGTDASLTDLRLVLLDNRLFTLQCLDRLDEASETLRQAFDIAAQRGAPDAGLQVAAAVHQFWLGDWDDSTTRIQRVLSKSAFTGFGLREGGPVLLMHGVGALIAVHRDDDVALSEHLLAGASLPMVTEFDRENCDFLQAARAMAAARTGDVAGAIEMFAMLLDRRYAQMMLRHQWLPDLVRLALAVEDHRTALAAADACAEEAAKETVPARASAAARRCRALVESDVDGLRAVAGHYRTVGRKTELGQTLEDLAIAEHAAGNMAAATTAADGASQVYHDLKAHWDLSRLWTRLGRNPD